QRLDDAPRQCVGGTQGRGDRRKPDREVPGPAKIETALEDGNSGLEIAAPEVQAADPGVRGDEGEGMIDGLGDAHRLASYPDAVLEVAEVREAPDQTGARVDRGKLEKAEGLTHQVAFEGLDVARQELRPTTIFTERVIRLPQVGVHPSPECEFTERVGDRAGRAAVPARTILIVPAPK